MPAPSLQRIEAPTRCETIFYSSWTASGISDRAVAVKASLKLNVGSRPEADIR